MGSGPTPGVTPTPLPTPTPLAGVVLGARTGTTLITFSDASPLPGATLTGCGPTAVGCAGRLTIRLDILSPVGGPVTGLSVFLHGANLLACLLGRVGPFELAAGVTRRVDVLLDQADQCGTPVEIRTADAVVEGPNGIASRQEWGVSYTLGR
ncbi:MAG: hypothetical protein ABI565_06165 [Vicinamibacteria bacterium]